MQLFAKLFGRKPKETQNQNGELLYHTAFARVMLFGELLKTRALKPATCRLRPEVTFNTTLYSNVDLGCSRDEFAEAFKIFYVFDRDDTAAEVAMDVLLYRVSKIVAPGMPEPLSKQEEEGATAEAAAFKAALMAEVPRLQQLRAASEKKGAPVSR